jgi:hypothetical protein
MSDIPQALQDAQGVQTESGDAAAHADMGLLRLCAEAMGWTVRAQGTYFIAIDVGRDASYIIGNANAPALLVYDPLHDDAQAMALVKRFRLSIGTEARGWYLCLPGYPHEETNNADLNRAIVECVAKMQRSKAP